MSYLFHSPAATMGVPRYISIDLDKQQTSCWITSESALPSRHLNSLIFLSICSLATLVCSFLSMVTRTPKYLTCLTHLIPPISGRSSLVRISDFFLLSRRFQSLLSYVNSFTTCSISGCEFDITSMSSAKASKSPLLLSSSSFPDDLSASSR
jgi:hypothetical protein